WPQINWNAKSQSIQEIANRLSLGLDAFTFIDDQPFERSEVAFAHPQVLCLDPVDLRSIPDMKRMRPRFVTDESSQRRMMYLGDVQRQTAEREFTGTSEAFLTTLGMAFTIARVGEDDLKRAEELTVRTHQLNTTGYTYSHEELDALRCSPDHLVLIGSLED